MISAAVDGGDILLLHAHIDIEYAAGVCSDALFHSLRYCIDLSIHSSTNMASGAYSTQQ